MVDNEKVGYGKPPKEQQFKKGKSGNPNGRPKGSKNTYTLLQKILDQKLEIIDNGTVLKISKKFAMLMQLVNKAVKGDVKAITALLPHMLAADVKEEESQKIIAILSKDDKEIIQRYLKNQKGINVDE